jgi:membrane dipeptidase
MVIVDAHLDLAYNALTFGRDYLQTVQQIRAAEAKLSPHDIATVSFPQLREAGTGLIFGTLFVLPATAPNLLESEKRSVYHDAQSAHRLGMEQLDYYRRLVDVEENRLRLVKDLGSLEEVLKSNESDQQPLLGIVPLMEGADPIREPQELELWFEKGLRVIGLAWDDTRYAAGAWRDSRHGLTKEGRALLEVMAQYGFILDLTHMNEKAALEALDQYEGPVAATHSNARALVPGERQLSDDQIQLLGERDGVIGVVLYNRFLRAGHKKGDPKRLVTLDHVLAHIDHICQMLGDARHVGLGSDFDGGVGAADIPAELDSSADLPLIAAKLRAYGYEEIDIAGIMGENWIHLLRKSFSNIAS